ncbi:hydroxymethylglutaryl-CoA reductase [Wenyingzhuangia fucanilytica]|uniref:3-hydroxy-3-methylglutaryl coenzyme A reductase n=1 Tax=Wenyingzhuangia fucanilytica TaxID=1790137 RepID=A0A1B1Y3V8_9FLAO|nr:hydroxymethylglutaryl-CoA reductase, degradative [Wenyingzhuangia fucanilytica]ANW95472.1 hydroxymethylglutaryl-CoA reductase [Wenyingzhuangia fucanilytica]
MPKLVSGFSKLNKEQKIEWLSNYFLKDNVNASDILRLYWNSDKKLQQLHDDFIENTVSNYYMPFGIAPNFIINNKHYTIPMAIEESSVVAAASLVAKFWSDKGGFKAEVINTVKVGQVHFMYEGDKAVIEKYFSEKKSDLISITDKITENMRKRGGGILDIELRDKTKDLEHYYQLHVTFETKDSMGANFINSCLEAMAQEFKNDDVKIVMSILSNYVPECLVRAEVSCKVDQLHPIDGALFAKKMKQAVDIANVDPHRAVTHNKGVMNGIDAVVIATGNDFRAVEAGVHAYAAKSGKYKSLTSCKVENDVFTFSIEIPLALGTVGGLTSTHPLSKLSLEMLSNPSAKELMQIIAVAGLAQNFAALRALTTTGIQEGHMKMHLGNILNQLEATPDEKEKVTKELSGQTVSYSGVADVLKKIRA